MQTVTRLLTNICSNNLIETKDFYTSLFDFKVNFESDWFIQLTNDTGNIELGIIELNNDLIPSTYQNKPNGFYITLVVENVDPVFELAKARKYKIVEPPQSTSYGQRRLLLKDPSGTLVDVSAPIKGFQF